MKLGDTVVRWFALLGLALLLGAASGCVSPQQKAEAQARLATLENKARSGELLTEQEWYALIQAPDGWNDRSTGWLFSLIGRPDETVSSERMGGTFLIYHNKCLDTYTAKPADLCFQTSFDLVDRHLFDARKVRNQ